MADLDDTMNAASVAQMGDVFRHLGPLLDKSNLKEPTRHQRGKAGERARARSGQKKKTLGKLVLRLDLQMRQQNFNCCLICFINNREESILPTLIQTTAAWKQLAEQGKAKKNLRSTLWEAIITTLIQRVQCLSKAKEGNVLLVKAKSVGLLLPDGTWPYQEWNPHQKQLVQSSKLPRKMDAMLANLHALEESSQDPSLVTSFHTMKPVPMDLKLTDQKEMEIYPWRLQLNPREDDPCMSSCICMGMQCGTSSVFATSRPR
eukprot:s1098_g15.t1